MIEDPFFLAAAYSACSASLSVLMAKVSPSIGARLRHVFAASAPMGVLFAFLLDGADSVTMHGEDLLVVGGMFAAGLTSSIVAGKLASRNDSKALRA